MVTAEKQTSRPFTGCDQVLAARQPMAVLSAPRAGGELRSGPTTENRKRAHRAPVELLGVWVITSPHKTSEGSAITSIGRPAGVHKAHALRAGCYHRGS